MWSQRLLPASFRGIEFDVISTDDDAQKATVEHDYPYRDGANVDDLGLMARRFNCEAVFFGDDYENALKRFSALLDAKGPGIFIHPVFGKIQYAQVVSYKIRHDADDVDACKLSISFIESKPSQKFFARSLPIQKTEAIGQKTNLVRTAISGLLANSVVKLVVGGFTQLRKFFNQAISIYRQGVAFVASTLDYLSYSVAFAADLAALTRSIISGQSFGIDSVKADWHTLSGIFSKPPALLASDGRGFYAKKNSAIGYLTDFSTKSLVPIFGIDARSYDAGVIQNYIAANGRPAYEAQIVLAHLGAESACSLADVLQIILALEADLATLSPFEIEAMVGLVRELIEAAIESYRVLYPIELSRPVTESLKDIALAVQDAALALMITRPPLVFGPAPISGNYRLIAHALYADHTRAVELNRLNPALAKPNTISQGDFLYYYAR